jgi:hypothetical protein
MFKNNFSIRVITHDRSGMIAHDHLNRHIKKTKNVNEVIYDIRRVTLVTLPQKNWPIFLSYAPRVASDKDFAFRSQLRRSPPLLFLKSEEENQPSAFSSFSHRFLNSGRCRAGTDP